MVQYSLAKLLAHTNNLTVVGDPDQSIYGYDNLSGIESDIPSRQSPFGSQMTVAGRTTYRADELFSTNGTKLAKFMASGRTLICCFSTIAAIGGDRRISTASGESNMIFLLLA